MREEGEEVEDVMEGEEGLVGEGLKREGEEKLPLPRCETSRKGRGGGGEEMEVGEVGEGEVGEEREGGEVGEERKAGRLVTRGGVEVGLAGLIFSLILSFSFSPFSSSKVGAEAEEEGEEEEEEEEGIAEAVTIPSLLNRWTDQAPTGEEEEKEEEVPQAEKGTTPPPSPTLSPPILSPFFSRSSQDSSVRLVVVVVLCKFRFFRGGRAGELGANNR